MFLGGMITCLFVSMICFLFSYLIWKKKELSFIAGYNEKTYRGDKEKLARVAGLMFFGIGILTVFLPFGLEFLGSITGKLYGIFIIVGLVSFVIYIKSNNKI